MPQNNKLFAKEWIKRAEDDELNLLSILKHRDGTPALACFLSHQTAEKYLKALLVLYKGSSPKIHSLIKLVSLLKPYHSLINNKLKKEVVFLEPYYIGTRYPADIPLESFHWNIAKKAYRAAKNVKKFVLGQIK